MGDQDGGGVGSSHSMPVHSRMDRLDSLIKYLEEKQNSSGWGRGMGMNSNHGVQKQGMPIDLAVRDIHTKGSILDRVALLENRLFQLCLEIEASSSTSRSYAAHTSDNTSDRQGSTTTDQSHSLESMDEEIVTSTDNPSSFHRALVSRFKFLGNSMTERTNSSTKHVITPKAETNEDTSKNEKRFKARNRRWKRMIGC
ncbi:hypothetical protein ACHQM5_007637 [Ranunculus cassubicifolius]